MLDYHGHKFLVKPRYSEYNLSSITIMSTPYRIPDTFDMSPFLVHISKDYDSMLSILDQGVIVASGPFGELNKSYSPSPQKSVCFSEKPIGNLKGLADRRSEDDGVYGIVFAKEFIKTRGGNRVWYVELGSTQHVSLESIVFKEQANSCSPFWNIVPFIELVSGDRTKGYDFYWEREWRVTSNVSFEPEDVSYLIIPDDQHQHQHQDARAFFMNAEEEGLGPNYSCDYIDCHSRILSSSMRKE